MRPGAVVAAISSATAERARLAREQADHVALKNAKVRGTLIEAEAVEREWPCVLRTVRSGLLAVPSRVQQRLPHLTAHDVAEMQEGRTTSAHYLAERPVVVVWPNKQCGLPEGVSALPGPVRDY